jgi:hypothetical protein
VQCRPDEKQIGKLYQLQEQAITVTIVPAELPQMNVASPRRAGGIPAIFAAGPAFTVRRHRRPSTRTGAAT